MGNVRLYGSTSGYTELAPPAVAPDGVLSLPSGTGTLLTAEGGKVLQIVRATDSTNRSTTSTTAVDVTGMAVTITPQKSESAIIVVASFYQSNSASTDNTESRYQITDASNNPISGAEETQSGTTGLTGTGTRTFRSPIKMWGYATPATTGAVTYKLRFKSSDASTTSTVANAVATGQMYAIEVSA